MSLDAGISAAGLILGVAGGAMTAAAKQKAFEATAAASIAGENVRELQMKFEGSRRRRAAVRDAIMARSMNLTTAANQGAQGGSGSQSGMGSAIAQGLENTQIVNSSEILGSRIFRANKAYHLANSNAQSVISAGEGLVNVGGSLVNSASSLAKLFGQA